MFRRIVRRFPSALCLSLVFLLVNSSLIGHSPSKGTLQVSEEAFVEWVKERAIPLDDLDWENMDLSFLAPLDKDIEGKRVVYLGEPDHYIHEKYYFQLYLIRYLFEHGFRHVGYEMGIFGGRMIDAYMEEGDPSRLDLATLFGDKRYRRDDRDDTPRGFPAARNPLYRKSHISELEWFLGEVRKLNETLEPGEERLHWFGFDVDILSGLGYKDIRERLSDHSTHPEIQEILQKIELVKEESVLEEAARIGDALAYVDETREAVTSLMGHRDFTLFYRDLQSLEDGLIFLEAFKNAPSPEWTPALHERERVIFRQMDELLEELGPDDKMILIGHNMHLSKDYRKARMGSISMWPSLGTHMVRRLPGKIYSIWMLYDYGRHGDAQNAAFFEDVPSDPRRIERLFTKAGLRFILPLHSQDPREQYLDADRGFVVNGNLGQGNIKSQADAVFFVSEVTPIRERKQPEIQESEGREGRLSTPRRPK